MATTRKKKQLEETVGSNTSEVVLDITFDLGGDALKIAYGYMEDERLVLGKIAEEGYVTQIGIPGIAFYSRKNKQWLYGYDVDNSGELDFTTIVRIKSLFMLCAKKRGKELIENPNAERIAKQNREYYESGKHFFKFALPQERKRLDDLKSAIEAGLTFEANCTPREVCEAYFRYVKDLIARRVEKLSEKTNLRFTPRYSVVYPPRVGVDYKTEFKNVIETVFFTKIRREMGATRALGMYASQSCLANGKPMLNNGENALFFDIGEEFISTSKICFEGKNMIVDGATGHKKAEPLGGVLVDSAIYDYLQRDVEDRKAFASMGQNWVEGCPESKKYQILKDIKTAKCILSDAKMQEKGLYPNGVDLIVPREFHIQKTLNAMELRTCIGVDAVVSDSVAERIYKFIKEEAEDPINKDVTKVFIAGGVIETSGLSEYIKKKLKKELGKEVFTFDVEQPANGGAYTIYANEASVYASSLGMTIASAVNQEESVLLSLCYGTFIGCQYLSESKYPANIKTTESVRSYVPFVDRGMVLKDGTNIFSDEFKANFVVTSSWTKTVISREEMFSCVLKKEDMRNKKDDGVSVTIKDGIKTHTGVVSYVYEEGSRYGGVHLAVGKPPQDGKDIRRLVAEKHFRLEQVFLDDIYIFDSENKRTRRRVQVRLKPGQGCDSVRFQIEEGIKVTKNGVVTPFVKNITRGSNDVKVQTQYWDNARGVWADASQKYISELYFDFREGKSFEAELSDDD